MLPASEDDTFDAAPEPEGLSLVNLTLRFRGHSSNVTDGVDLSVRPGEVLCLVGESGSGKSVTSLALMGLLPKKSSEISSGHVSFAGEHTDLSRRPVPPALRGSKVAMIFQEPMTSLNPVFRIGLQITEAIRHHQSISPERAKARAVDLLKKVGIANPEQRFNAYPHQLSGGMRQRVMIAMALANDPDILIADEPTTALDVTIQAQILDLIRDLSATSGMGTILITHDLGVVAEIADTVAVMYGGQVVERGPVSEVFAAPQHPYTIGLMSAMPGQGTVGDRLAIVPGTVPGIDQMPLGCRFSTRCPFATSTCVDRPALQEMGGGHSVACHFAPLEANLTVTQ